MPDKHLLIVQTSPRETRGIRELLPVLAGKYRLEAFTARQRLIGRGLGYFAEGARGKLEELATLLEQHGVATHLIRPTRPRFVPARVRNFTIRQEFIEFQTRQGPVRLERGERVLAVLADLSGEVVDKSVKRLLVQNAYQGAEAVTPIDDEELYRTVLRSRPVLDLYLLNPQGQARTALRIFAGRFDPQGLGERATYSVTGNLENLIQLAREYAGGFTLKCDFGLSRLPGCRLKKAEQGQDTQRENLASLTRFGWLSVDLESQQQPTTAGGDALPLQTPLTAAAVASQPALAALAAGSEALSAIREELKDGEDAPRQPDPEPERRLPPPPDAPPAHPFAWRKHLLGSGGGILGGVLFFAFMGFESGLGTLIRQGVRSGILPAALSAGLFWGAFHYLRLKRQVENTPTSKTRSLAMGLVEVHGRAKRQYALVSPMTQMPCVYYRLRRYRRDDKKNWRMTSETDSGAVPFYLEDDTGRVSVNPWGATVRARTRQEGHPGQVALVLSRGSGGDHSEKWVEEIIYEGTSLYVLGFARPRQRQRKTLRERTIEALRDLKLDPKALQKYDSDGDGRISEQEWEAARSRVEEQVLQQSLAQAEETTSAAGATVIGRADSRTLPFVIAETESEAHLTRNLGLLAMGMFGTALAAALWGGASMLKLFHP
ncbi:hypothetical protein DESUT3_03770 [Desulfuromonas versatilis]|uniref:RING-type E3 ubiquitin transferase n=1 Tax=Desulfuromonas versatilis TaxID=2802975 RepID=A0ABM8HP44_9BACT|nr:E3 ubiquitin ligase family protein [Desulfuromonas versatilis]BCR03308.1 hypothetical protein DESUT3_03770 [Desulfuromonas versatilis]